MQKPLFFKAYSAAFWRMCFSSLLFFASFNLVIPELPAYFMLIGGKEEHKGYIIALFTLVAMASRPFSGRLSDTIGRVPVMMFGVLVCVALGFLYPLLQFVAGFFVLRFLHGFSTGFTPTGNAAYVADIVPVGKRGEAMGYLGFFNSLGMAIGPAVGSQLMLWLNGSYAWLFACSSLVALLSALVIFGLPETLKNRQPMRLGLLRVKWVDIYEPRVWQPFVALLLTAFSFGVVLTLVPDLATHLGMQNKGTFFSVFTLSSLLSRLTAGRVSDRVGRVKVLYASTTLLALALVLIAFATDKYVFMGGAAVYGFALGINSPTIYAWAIDLSSEKHKGRGMGTVYIGLELAIGAGALVAGYVFGGNFNRINIPFLVAATLSLLAFIFLLVFGKKRVKE
ncbi:MFS transporter [bacterium]|nr:MFS transporter [bacterium]